MDPEKTYLQAIGNLLAVATHGELCACISEEIKCGGCGLHLQRIRQPQSFQLTVVAKERYGGHWLETSVSLVLGLRDRLLYTGRLQSR